MQPASLVDVLGYFLDCSPFGKDGDVPGRWGGVSIETRRGGLVQEGGGGGGARAHVKGVVLLKRRVSVFKRLHESLFLEPLLRTLLRTFPPSKTRCKIPS